MRTLSFERIELARINLAYAQAEIIYYGDGSDFIERVLRHVQRADSELGAISGTPLATACEPTNPEEQG